MIGIESVSASQSICAGWSTKPNLSCRKSFDEEHRGATQRAGPERSRLAIGIRVRWNRIRFSGRCGREQLFAKWEQNPAATASQETKVPDADESTRQHMQQEAAQELIDGQREESLLIFVSGIPP